MAKQPYLTALARANKYVTSGTMTYSKQTHRYVKGIYPNFIECGGGPYVYGDNGETYIDYISSLGANLLGYADPFVNKAVKDRIDRGTLFSFASPLEGQLAEKLNSIVPAMESMRFLKSGSEAVSAGVKIARAYTERELIISVGYHGWHDWSSASSPKSAGSPDRLKPLCINVAYNDFKAMKDIFKEEGDNIAAVVIDPYIYEEPKDNYLYDITKLARRHGALMIFDEVVTGMRWLDYTVANFYELKPDLIAMGKAMANGFPISVIGGKKKIMKVLDGDCFVSTTFGGDLSAISASLATIDICESDKVQERIYEMGEDLKMSFNEIAASLGLDAMMVGNPARMKFNFPTDIHQALFWQECAKKGVLFGYATHVTLSHTPSVISKTIDIVGSVLKYMASSWKNPITKIEGDLPVKVEAVAARR